jgi:histone H3/H4
MADVNIIVKSKIKEVVTDVNVGSDFVGALNTTVCELIQKAKKRCLDNGRKTLKPQDL